MVQGADKTLSIKEAAGRLGISPVRLRRLVQQGRVPAQRVHWIWTILEADLEKVPAVLHEMEVRAHRAK